MNIIQTQADEFIRFKMKVHKGHKEFLNSLKSELWEYKKDTYKIEFINRVIKIVKITYDEHLPDCTDLKGCHQNKFYENTLFFLQEELEELEKKITPENFNKEEKIKINETLELILNNLNELKLGQKLTYDDFSDEFEELKDLYYLNKKNWLQLFNGKISEMIAGGVISETVSKNIVKVLTDNYDKLIAG